MNFGLDFGSIGIVKTLCLTYRNVFMIYVGKLVGMCKLFFFFFNFNFYFYDHGKILWVLWKNFVGYVRIYLCMKLWELFLGMQRFSFCMAMEKFGSCSYM